MQIFDGLLVDSLNLLQFFPFREEDIFFWRLIFIDIAIAIGIHMIIRRY